MRVLKAGFLLALAAEAVSAMPTASTPTSGDGEPLLPKTSRDCFDLHYRNSWDFIEPEYRTTEYFSENVQECLEYAQDPVGFMRRYNDKTPYVPTRRWDCSDRKKLRRMNTEELVGKTGNMKQKRRYCEAYIDRLTMERNREVRRENDSRRAESTFTVIGVIIGAVAVVLCLVSACRKAARWEAGEAGEVRVEDLVPDPPAEDDTQVAVRNARENDLGWNSSLYGPPAASASVEAGQKAPNYETIGAPPTYEEATKNT